MARLVGWCLASLAVVVVTLDLDAPPAEKACVGPSRDSDKARAPFRFFRFDRDRHRRFDLGS
jgi:hypothetical protein